MASAAALAVAIAAPAGAPVLDAGAQALALIAGLGDAGADRLEALAANRHALADQRKARRRSTSHTLLPIFRHLGAIAYVYYPAPKFFSKATYITKFTNPADIL